jgi:23S rRNA (uracil1939-C5)-methyltransferase
MSSTGDVHKVGDEIDVRIAKIVPRGFGLAFAERLTVFVPLAAAGDLVRVRIDRIQKRTAFAEIVAVLEPSTLRIEPRCRYFGKCGGCDLQHISYEDQLNAKVGILRDSFLRIGKVDIPEEIRIIPNPQPFGYRSRVRWHASRDLKAFGYFGRGSHDVIDVETCPILDPVLEDELRRQREGFEWETMWSELAEIVAACGEGGKVSVVTDESDGSAEEIIVSAGGEAYSFSANVFFQGSKAMIGDLIEAALGASVGGSALDLYCGVGLFTLPMARRFKEVTGVEGNFDAVRFAKRNAANAGTANIRFIANSVANFLERGSPASIDLILLDPPRTGAEKGVIDRISKLKPREISYVSCDPSILARDLRVLLGAGYGFQSITVLDLFPQTHHVETVVRLMLR